jgi:7-carboxy-7-deazaguanine synthase
VRIAEIFQSRQGEGLLTGRESVFVRTSGCNLRCWFCDTPYASWTPEGDDLSVEEILAQIERWDTEHVVLTGGEPMLFAELVPLAQAIRSGGRHLTIETAGTLDLPVECDLMSISPKLLNSLPSEAEPRWRRRHDRTRRAPDVIRALVDRYDYQFKFVIDTPDDLAEMEIYLQEFPRVDRRRVLLMPQGTSLVELQDRVPWIVAYAQEHGLGYSPRKHIEWYGFTRGT